MTKEGIHKKIIKKTLNKKKATKSAKSIFWFLVGVGFASLCLATFFLIYFKIAFKDHIIPGVFIGTMNVGTMEPKKLKKIFDDKNKKIQDVHLTFSSPEGIATLSAKDLNIGYDTELMMEQAASVGNGNDLISNVYYIINSYLNGTYLPVSYTTNTDKLVTLLAPIQKKVYLEPQDALFDVENNKVVAFKQSTNGKTIDFEALQKKVQGKIPAIIDGNSKNITFSIPEKVLKPKIPTEKANNLGIVEKIGEGTSLFHHSIPGRIHNVALAASKINGVLVAPGEEFSFDKNLGDVSQYTGYQQAYVIQNGKTVLGDGGGVCQVSTTLFRALLNAGLPITDRTAHAYRVGYYEEESPPGLDATVYYPTVDLKFKNDTSNYILIVESIDLTNLRLTFTLYGKNDGRQVVLTTPVVTNQIPAPADVFQDDPTLPKGQVKQVDFAAAGATVSFSRTVTKNGKPYIQETFRSVYRPWQAIFLRGTKEG